MLLFGPSRSFNKLTVGSRAEIVARPHAEAITDEIRGSQDDDDATRKTRASHAGNHGEGRHDSIDGAVYKISKVVCRRPGLDTLSDRGRGVRRTDVHTERSAIPVPPVQAGYIFPARAAVGAVCDRALFVRFAKGAQS